MLPVILTVSSCQMASDEDDEVETMLARAPVLEEITEEDTPDEEAAASEEAAATPIRSLMTRL